MELGPHHATEPVCIKALRLRNFIWDAFLSLTSIMGTVAAGTSGFVASWPGR